MSQMVEKRQRAEARESNKKNNGPRQFKNVNVVEEKKRFLKKLEQQIPDALTKKYFYINIWDTGCWESMKQLPKLDTLVEPLRKDMAYIFVCDEKPDYALRKLKEFKVITKNFIYVNQADSFINAIYKEKNIKFRHGGFGGMSPMNLIVDQSGKILYFDTLYAISGTKKDTASDRKFVLSLHNALINPK